jgi:antirestriction protein
MLNIYINTWGNYNENGADGGRWVTLPMDEEELAETLADISKSMGDNDPEFAIHDYEWDGYHVRDIGENESILKLNEEVEELASLDEWEIEETLAAVDAFGYSVEEAIEKQQRGYFTFYRNMTLEDVAEELVEECYTPDSATAEFFARYFNYEAFARDLGFDGYTETDFGVIVE